MPSAMLAVLLLVASSCVSAQQHLDGVGTAANPYGSTWVEQMAFDPTNRTLYLANFYRHTIVQVFQATAVPLTPPPVAAPWGYAVLAGQDGLSGVPGLAEASSDVATLYGPGGVTGWPQYAVGPTTTSASDTATSTVWVGLWVADMNNNALRFVHFQRRNNVTLVAGSPIGVHASQDGIGAGALLYAPRNLAWGRFLLSEAASSDLNRTDIDAMAAWTSVVLWSDSGNHCLRQGVPLHNDSSHSLLENITSVTLAADSLHDMVLNVSTFAGFCRNTGSTGTRVGLVMPWSAMFTTPWGVAVTSRLPTLPTSVSTILFVGDNNRLSMIAPMYPPTARFLTVVYANFGYNLAGVNHVDTRLIRCGSMVSVDLVVSGQNSRMYFNVSVQLLLMKPSNSSLPTSGSLKIYQGAGNVSMNIFATTGIKFAWNMAMVRYTPNGSFNGTLVVFSGWNGPNGMDPVLQYYCCLGPEYSEFGVDEQEAMPPCYSTPTESRSVTARSVTSGTHTLPSTGSLSVSSVSTSVDMSPSYARVTASRTKCTHRTNSGSISSSNSRASGVTLTPSRVHATSRTTPFSDSTTHVASVSITGSLSGSLLFTSTTPSASVVPSHTTTPTFEWPFRVPVVPPAVQAAVAWTSGMAAASGGGVATALASMGLAERCLMPLQQDATPLSFPMTLVPGWSIGASYGIPKLPFLRAAAVGSLIAHVVVAVAGVCAVGVMMWIRLSDRHQWYTDVLLRLPLTVMMAVDGLLLDGGVGGGATAVHANGVVEIGFLFCGFVGPVTVGIMVGVMTWRRSSAYEANWLLEGAPLKKRQVLMMNEKTPVGVLHRWVVGMGAWRGADRVDRLCVAAYLKYRGPGNLVASRKMRLSPFYSSFAIASNIILSSARASATPTSCVLPSAVSACVCTMVLIVFAVLRPMTSPVKNAVGLFLGTYAAVNAWVLLAAAVQGSSYLIGIALMMAEWQAYLSGINVIITFTSYLLSQWAAWAGVKRKQKGVDLEQLLMQLGDDDDVSAIELGSERASVSDETLPALEPPMTNLLRDLLADDDATGTITNPAANPDLPTVPSIPEASVLADGVERPEMPLSELVDVRMQVNH